MSEETDKGDCPSCIFGVMDEGECRNCRWREGDPVLDEEPEPEPLPPAHGTIRLIEVVGATEFTKAVLGTRWEEWEWWAAVTYDTGYGFGEHPADPYRCFLTVKIDNPDYNGEGTEGTDNLAVFRRRVSVKRIADAYIKYRQEGGRESWSDLDAGSADSIMQIVVFGKVVYG